MRIPGLDILSKSDPSSFGNPEEVIVRHAHVEWNVNFQRQVLTGSVKLTVEKLQDAAKKLILDSKDLTINKISFNGKPLQYSAGEKVFTFGQKLEITLPNVAAKKIDIDIDYETSPNASALQWLTAEQTSAKKQPYMFSQCQSIHCRTIMPCQDSPGVKLTYTAEVVADAAVTVLMSAIRCGSPVDEPDSKRRHKFEQQVPIPSYLLAIVVAALTSRRISDRCDMWAEEPDVDASAWEFAQAEEMLQAAEELCGPYEWGRYDLLVLPPSFAYGGMENPCLTFIAPSCVVGDRTLTEVIAHEISHSWSGNLVSIKNYEHFWLNEGWTIFLQRKIVGRLYGNPHRHFSAILGMKELTDEINSCKFPEFETTLVKDLKGIDPEDVFNKVPYEKGHTFLFYLETILGGTAAFDPFVKSYFKKFRNQSINTDQIKEHLYDFFVDKRDILDKVDWKTWLFGVGMPPVIPEYENSLAIECDNLAERWQKCNDSDLSSLEATPGLSQLHPNQQIEFLNILLLSENCISKKKLAKMLTLYEMDKIRNSEIKFRWLRLCLKAKWEDKIGDALAFATSQGRMKFVKPLFRDLYQWEFTRQQALDEFQANRSKMMYLTSRQVAMDLELKE